MSDFSFYLELGLFHVLDWKAYDHLLFLVALSIPFSFRQFKTVFWLVTFFTLGHTVSLFISVYEIIRPPVNLIEILIPITIIVTGVSNIINSQKNKTNYKTGILISLFFGIIHGFGFGNYFNQISFPFESKIEPLISFAFGVEIAQLIIVLAILIINFLVVNLLTQEPMKYIRIGSAFIIGFSFNMLINIL